MFKSFICHHCHNMTTEGCIYYIERYIHVYQEYPNKFDYKKTRTIFSVFVLQLPLNYTLVNFYSYLRWCHVTYLMIQIKRSVNKFSFVNKWVHLSLQDFIINNGKRSSEMIFLVKSSLSSSLYSDMITISLTPFFGIQKSIAYRFVYLTIKIALVVNE